MWVRVWVMAINSGRANVMPIDSLVSNIDTRHGWVGWPIEKAQLGDRSVLSGLVAWRVRSVRYPSEMVRCALAWCLVRQIAHYLRSVVTGSDAVEHVGLVFISGSV